jgi:hypothetical protein
MRKLALTTVLYALTLGAPLVAGTIITVDRRDLPDGTPEPMIMSIEGRLVAIAGDPDGGRIIFRGEEQQMLIVDDEDKTYMVLDQAMIQGIATQMSAMMKQVEQAIASLPKEQQEMARRALQQQNPAAAPTATPVEEDVRRTSERATREGYPCVKYEVFEEGAKIRELWVTDWSNVRGQGDIATAMRSFADFAESLTSSVSGLGGASSPSSIGSSIASWWHGIEGLPIVTTDIEDGHPVEESVVRSIEAADLDPRKVFEVPEDYTLETIGGDQ